MVLFTMLFKAILTFEYVDEIPKSVMIDTKAIEEYFPVILLE